MSARTGSRGHIIYTLQGCKQFTVKAAEDFRKCRISGICELPGGKILVADSSYNSNVKLLNKAYHVISVCLLPDWPWNVCHTDGEEVAVSVDNISDNRHEIQFLSVQNGEIEKTRKLRLGHKCDGVAYHQGQLYVASGTALYVYTVAGKMVKKLYEDTSDDNTVHACAVSDDGKRVYVTNCHRQQLITLDSNGYKIATLSDPDLLYPRSVHVNTAGHVFVCASGSCTVVQVDRDGKQKLATLATETDGVRDALVVWYSTKTSSLIVGQWCTDDILVLKLK